MCHSGTTCQLNTKYEILTEECWQHQFYVKPKQHNEVPRDEETLYGHEQYKTYCNKYFDKVIFYLVIVILPMKLHARQALHRKMPKILLLYRVTQLIIQTIMMLLVEIQKCFRWNQRISIENNNRVILANLNINSIRNKFSPY